MNEPDVLEDPHRLCPECGGRWFIPGRPTYGHRPKCKAGAVLAETLLGLQVIKPEAMVQHTMIG